jgi:Gpi18-like mannosyltransferase
MLRFQRIWRLLLIWGIAVIAIWTLAVRVSRDPSVSAKPTRAAKSAVEAMSTWDGRHYETVAQHGYTAAHPEIRQLNFFPLYPKIVRLLGGTSHTMLAGVVLSQLMALASILLMSAMAHGEKSAPLLREPGFWMLINPFSFFLFSFYTESLFLFLFLVHYAAFRHNRTKLSFFAGFLAGLTRPTSLVLPALLGFEALKRKWQGEKWQAALICAMAPAIGLASYVLGYIAWKTGSINGYMDMSHRYWPQYMVFPFSGYARELKYTIERVGSGLVPGLDILLRTLSTTAVLGVLIARRKHLDPALMAYSVATLIFVQSIAPLRSTGRFELVLFPVFFALAASSLPRFRSAWLLIAPCAYLWMKAFMHFASWDWIA